MKRLSLRNDRLMFKAAQTLPIVVKEFVEYTCVREEPAVSCR